MEATIFILRIPTSRKYFLKSKLVIVYLERYYCDEQITFLKDGLK